VVRDVQRFGCGVAGEAVIAHGRGTAWTMPPPCHVLLPVVCPVQLRVAPQAQAPPPKLAGPSVVFGTTAILVQGPASSQAAPVEQQGLVDQH
jgi:hypothetical protein